MTLRKAQRITVRCTLKMHQEIHGYKVSILNERLSSEIDLNA
jgi:hypothetical protein